MEEGFEELESQSSISPQDTTLDTSYESPASGSREFVENQVKTPEEEDPRTLNERVQEEGSIGEKAALKVVEFFSPVASFVENLFDFKNKEVTEVFKDKLERETVENDEEVATERVIAEQTLADAGGDINNLSSWNTDIIINTKIELRMSSKDLLLQ